MVYFELKNNEMVRNERFRVAIDYLYKEGLIADQTELSQKTGITVTTVSRILNNRVKEPSEATIRRLNEAFGNIFNPAYFRCESDRLLMADDEPVQKVPDIIDLCSRLVSEVEELRKDVRKQFDEVAEMRNSLREERKAMTQLIQQLAALAQPQKGYTYQPPKKPQNIADQQ